MKKDRICYFKIALSVIAMMSSISIASAEPVIKNVVHTPEKPLSGGEVTFWAKIYGYNISSVNIIVKECQENGVCFLDSQNVSMNDEGNDTFSAVVKLKHPDATKVEYYLDIKSGENWYKSNISEFNLSVKSITNKNGGGSRSPGFGIPVLLSSMILLVLIKRRISK